MPPARSAHSKDWNSHHAHKNLIWYGPHVLVTPIWQKKPPWDLKCWSAGTYYSVTTPTLLKARHHHCAHSARMPKYKYKIFQNTKYKIFIYPQHTSELTAHIKIHGKLWRRHVPLHADLSCIVSSEKQQAGTDISVIPEWECPCSWVEWRDDLSCLKWFLFSCRQQQ